VLGGGKGAGKRQAAKRIKREGEKVTQNSTLLSDSLVLPKGGRGGPVPQTIHAVWEQLLGEGEGERFGQQHNGLVALGGLYLGEKLGEGEETVSARLSKGRRARPNLGESKQKGAHETVA